MELEKTVIDDKQMLFELPQEAGNCKLLKENLLKQKTIPSS